MIFSIFLIQHLQNLSRLQKIDIVMNTENQTELKDTLLKDVVFGLDQVFSR